VTPRTRLSLRVLAVIGLSAALVIPIANTRAAPSTHFTEHRVDAQCEALETDGAIVRLSVSVSDRVGSTAELQVWFEPATPDFDPPTLVSDSVSLSLATDDSSLSGSIDLVNLELGTPAGAADLVALLAPSGPSETIERTASGNHKQREVEIIQPLSVSGSFSLPAPGGDIVVPLDACMATATDTTFFSNAPSSIVDAAELLVISCEWISGESFVGIRAEGDRNGAHLDVAVVLPEGSFSNVDDSTAFTRRQLTASADLLPSGVGVIESGGHVTADADLLRLGDRVAWVSQAQGSTLKVSVQPLSVQGEFSLTLDDGTQMTFTMSDDTCQASDRSERLLESARQGQNTEPRANDTPEAAAAINPGGAASAHTGGAAFEGEMPTACLTFDTPEGPFALNLAHSVWYSFVGTGGPVTIDTSGSDFDTVLAVYVSDNGILSEVGCADDQPLDPFGVSRQAHLTFDTDAGVVYLIQAGGFVQESGHLTLRIS
jgi:hypothetical protein